MNNYGKMILAENSIFLLKTDNVLYKYTGGKWGKYKTDIKNASFNNGILFVTDINNQL